MLRLSREAAFLCSPVTPYYGCATVFRSRGGSHSFIYLQSVHGILGLVLDGVGVEDLRKKNDSAPANTSCRKPHLPAHQVSDEFMMLSPLAMLAVLRDAPKLDSNMGKMPDPPPTFDHLDGQINDLTAYHRNDFGAEGTKTIGEGTPEFTVCHASEMHFKRQVLVTVRTAEKERCLGSPGFGMSAEYLKYKCEYRHRSPGDKFESPNALV